MCYNSFVESARSFRALRTMRPRHAVPLTPSESALTTCLPYRKQIASVSPLESALTSYPQLTENTATLSLAESALTRLAPASRLESALTKTPGVGGVSLPFWNEFTPSEAEGPLATILKFFLFTFLPTLLHSSKTQAFCFQAIPHSLAKTTGVGGIPLFATRDQNQITERGLRFPVV
jgi:hypothetical protein